MSTPQERLDVIKANYDQAADNEAEDLASAKTAVDVAGVRANIGNARLAYYAAIAAALIANGTDVEAAHQEAKDALKAVKDARAVVEQMATLLGKLTKATDKANKLLQKAKA